MEVVVFVLLVLWCLAMAGFNYMTWLSWNGKTFPLNGKMVGIHDKLKQRNWYICFSSLTISMLLAFTVVVLVVTA